MSSRKRNRQAASSAAVEDGQCTIKLAVASLSADFTTLRVFSSCARGLPVDAQEWDISGLLVDGQPVSSATLEAWLACVDSMLSGSPLEGSKKEQLATATGLQQLLLFADAVGSVGGVLNVCLSELRDLTLVVKVKEESIELRMGMGDGAYHIGGEQEGGGLVLYYATLHKYKAVVHVTFQHDDDVLDCRQQVASQIEALLYVGHMLQLPELLRTVHSFIFKGHTIDGGVLEGYMPGVFSERVLAAAVGSNQLSRDAYMTSVLTQPCSAHDVTGLHRLLKVVEHPRYDREREELCWDAELAQTFFGCAAGSQVNVQLDLLSSEGPAIRFGEEGPWLRAQILLGHGVYNQQTRTALLQGDESE